MGVFRRGERAYANNDCHVDKSGIYPPEAQDAGVAALCFFRVFLHKGVGFAYVRESRFRFIRHPSPYSICIRFLLSMYVSRVCGLCSKNRTSIK